MVKNKSQEGYSIHVKLKMKKNKNTIYVQGIKYSKNFRNTFSVAPQELFSNGRLLHIYNYTLRNHSYDLQAFLKDKECLDSIMTAAWGRTFDIHEVVFKDIDGYLKAKSELQNAKEKVQFKMSNEPRTRFENFNK